MRTLVWILRLAFFLVLLAFAARNMQPATLSFFAGLEWETPLIVILLATFSLGGLVTVLALLPFILRQRREILRLGAVQAAAPQAITPELSNLISPISLQHPVHE